MPLRVPTGRALYWWVYGVNPGNSRGVVMGPYTHESDAQQAAQGLGEPDVFKLPTRDMNRATRIIKNKRSAKVGISRALEKVGHIGGKQDAPDISEVSDDDDI